jgi:hypothetical protein
MLVHIAIGYSQAVLLHAQGNGTIHGTVTDPSGAAVPNAKVITLSMNAEPHGKSSPQPAAILFSRRSPSALIRLQSRRPASSRFAGRAYP